MPIDNPFLIAAESHLLAGDWADALRVARMGLTLDGENLPLWFVAAHSATELGLNDEACRGWLRCTELAPTEPEPLNSLAIVLERLGRPAQAEAAYRRALALTPDNVGLVTNLGLLLENQGRLDDALALQRRALGLAADSAEIHSNFAGVAARLGLWGEAEAAYRRAIDLQPDRAASHSNFGVLLTDLRRDAEAEASFRRALRLDPAFVGAQANLGQLLLAQGRFDEGWVLHEARPGHLPLAAEAEGPCLRWTGQPLAGKAVLLLPEQGFGDEIQFARFVPWLKAQGAARVTLACWPALRRLMETLPGVDAVVGLEDCHALLASHDYWTFLLSLPLYAGTRIDTIPVPIPYLAADPQRIARSTPRLAGDGLRVGLVWRGNPGHANDAERSLPGLDVLAPLWRVPGVRFFSLQKSGSPLPAPPAGQPLVDLGDAIDDFADTAAVLVQLDLLISVDTATAHLAGALGVPCWILLPWLKTDWRWLQGRSDSPWYPSVRLFRQVRRACWQAPVEGIAAALGVLADAAPSRSVLGE